MNSKKFWNLFFLAIVLLLSIQGYRKIPRGPFWGLDFQNLYAFQNCENSLTPYEVSGEECGDHFGRAMYYPPLLYWSFTWVRAFDFKTAIFIWNFITILLMLWTLKVWLPTWRGPPLFFSLLLFLQVPLLFALERGNNDVLVLVLWTFIYLLYRQNKFFLSGVVGAAATLLKVYPGIPIAGLTFTFLMAKSKSLKGYLLGGILGGTVIFLLTFQNSLTYFFTVLPSWSSAMQPIHTTSHSLHSLGWPTPVVIGLSGILFCVWVYRSQRILQSDLAYVFAGWLAISTYFSRISNDYNLVTIYPLFFLLFHRTLHRDPTPGSRRGLIQWSFLWIGVLAFFGNRFLFENPLYSALSFHKLLQWSWLLCAGMPHFYTESQPQK